MNQLEGITMPEVIIYNALESIVRYVKKDIEEHEGDEQSSILYHLLGENIDGKPLRMNRWKFYEQAKHIFQDKQNLNVNFGYNFEVAKLLSLHIILPSEEAAESAIGQDEGVDNVVDRTGRVYPVFSQNFRSTYQVMITSNNNSEVLTAYHVLKAMLLMIVPHLEVLGLRLNKFSGSDVMFRDEMMPSGIFHRVINLTFNYELRVPQLVAERCIKGIIFEGHLLEDIKEDCPWGCDDE